MSVNENYLISINNIFLNLEEKTFYYHSKKMPTNISFYDWKKVIPIVKKRGIYASLNSDIIIFLKKLKQSGLLYDFYNIWETDSEDSVVYFCGIPIPDTFSVDSIINFSKQIRIFGITEFLISITNEMGMHSPTAENLYFFFWSLKKRKKLNTFLLDWT